MSFILTLATLHLNFVFIPRLFQRWGRGMCRKGESSSLCRCAGYSRCTGRRPRRTRWFLSWNSSKSQTPRLSRLCQLRTLPNECVEMNMHWPGRDGEEYPRVKQQRTGVAGTQQWRWTGTTAPAPFPSTTSKSVQPPWTLDPYTQPSTLPVPRSYT